MVLVALVLPFESEAAYGWVENQADEGFHRGDKVTEAQLVLNFGTVLFLEKELIVETVDVFFHTVVVILESF